MSLFNMDTPLPLGKGAQGKYVIALQNALNQFADGDGNALFQLNITGLMDADTLSALTTLSNMLVSSGNKALSNPLNTVDYQSIVGDSPDYTTGSDDGNLDSGLFRHHRQTPESLHFSIGKGKHKFQIGMTDAQSKALGNKISNDFKKDIKAVGKVIQAAGKILKELGEDVVFAPLLPFKGAMKKEIAKAGLTTDNSMADVIRKAMIAMAKNKEEGHFESYHIDGTDAQAMQQAANQAVQSGDVPANPPVDKTDKSFTNLMAVATNEVTPLIVTPAEPVPQIIVTAVTAAGSLVGVPAPVCMIGAQTIWGFLHKEKHKPGSDVHTAIKTIQNDDDFKKEREKKDEVGASLSIGGFKIKAAVFAPVAIFLVIGILVAVSIFKKKS